MTIQSLSAYSGHFNKLQAPGVKFAGVLEEQQAALALQQAQQQDEVNLQAQAKRRQVQELDETFLKDGDTRWSKLRLLRLVNEMQSADLKRPGNIAAWVLSPVTIAAGLGLGGLCIWAFGDVPGGFPLADFLPENKGRASEEKLMGLFGCDDTKKAIAAKLLELHKKDNLIDFDPGKGYFLNPKGEEVLTVAI